MTNAVVALFVLLGSLLGVALYLGAVLGVSMPIVVCLTRLRANYLPKAVSLDNVLEDGRDDERARQYSLQALFLQRRRSAAKIGPVVHGVFPMMLRTRRLEGWRGLYTGTTLVVLQLLAGIVLAFVYMLWTGMWRGRIPPLGTLPGRPGQFPALRLLLVLIALALVALPFDVVVQRTMVHPRTINWWRPRMALREVLSPQEIAQPWRLYALPGLLAAVLLRVTWVGFVTMAVRQLTVPALGGLPALSPSDPGDDVYDGPNSHMLEVSAAGLALYLAWMGASLFLVAPLDCMIVRLATQRPVHQQPLHVAYADAPAPYSHQATVPRGGGPGGGGPGASDPRGQGPWADDAPADEPRASFTIDDDADADAHASPAPDDNATAAPADEESAALRDDAPAALADEESEAFGGDAPETLREPVIALRPCEEPASAAEPDDAETYFGAAPVERYDGLADCARKMLDEEGYESLLRGAGWTLASLVFTSFG
ncbi:hypothetical protein MSPP1_003215 [Malassezia sp. CBS 17886]|nr:hypothetical protein MSPP1_003215 [Malassezia sp. CBS 17886]